MVVTVGVSVGAGVCIAVDVGISGRAVGASDAVGDGAVVLVGVPVGSGVSVAGVDLQAARDKVVTINTINRKPMSCVRCVITIISPNHIENVPNELAACHRKHVQMC
jgi:hypothetical protein